LTSEQEQEPIEMVDRRRARMAAEAAANDGAGTAEAEAANTAAGDESVELAAEREKAETYYKNWQRSAADFINYKRRVEQDRSENARLANAAMVINILPVFDDIDRAVSTVDANLAGLNWVQGVVAIHRKFSQLLDSMGVTEIESAGQPFDPSKHEAIGQAPGEEGKVLHVVQKGYSLGDRVIRPAMVIVGQGASSG
jgi:molecular chaperone GrpE